MLITFYKKNILIRSICKKSISKLLKKMMLIKFLIFLVFITVLTNTLD